MTMSAPIHPERRSGLDQLLETLGDLARGQIQVARTVMDRADQLGAALAAFLRREPQQPS